MRRSEGRATTLVLTALAAYRVTRLVTTDSLTRPVREALFDRWPPDEERARLRWVPEIAGYALRPEGDRPAVVRSLAVMTCSWCAGFWVTGVAVAAMKLDRPVLTTLALSTVVGMIGAVDGALA